MGIEDCYSLYRTMLCVFNASFAQCSRSSRAVRNRYKADDRMIHVDSRKLRNGRISCRMIQKNNLENGGKNRIGDFCGRLRSSRRKNARAVR